MTISGFTDCHGNPAGQGGSWQVVNSSASDKGTYTLYTGTADSINTFYAGLEQKVGLCNVVHTAVQLGLTRADGKSLLSGDGKPGTVGYQYSADDEPSFTLGSVNVSPMSMAAAYATVASGGIYCAPTAITKIVDEAGHSLPAPSAGCHRVLSSDVANAANYILQGVFTWQGATGLGLGPLPSGYPIAGKTGTSNVATGDGTPYAAFAGYTTNLVSYTSVFNPISPTVHDTMGGTNSCYRAFGGYLACSGEMFGADAPGSTWRVTFDAANLTGSHAFGLVSPSSALWSKGNGQYVPPPPAKKGGKGGKGGGGTGGGGTGGGGTGGGGTPTPPTPPGHVPGH
jgi:membrane peptidoglycan carboxypeptidase